MFELQQSSALVREAFECRGSGRNIWGARNIDTTTRDEDYELKLSDAFMHEDKSGRFEWTARVLNINKDYNLSLISNIISL